MTDLDTIARMTIRLSRGFRQGWALAIPKTRTWDWDTAVEYAASARRAPEFHRSAGLVTHKTSGGVWTLDTEGDIELEFAHGSVQATTVSLADGRSVPAIIARSPSFGDLRDHDVWKLDVAITSLSCGPWAPLHALPPLRVLSALRLPKTPCALAYAEQSIHAREPDMLHTHPFEARLVKFGAAGGFQRWDRLVVGPQSRIVKELGA